MKGIETQTEDRRKRKGRAWRQGRMTFKRGRRG